MVQTASQTFIITAGALVRGRVKREVQRAAWEHGLSVDVEESRGVLESVYNFTIRGEALMVRAFYVAVADCWGVSV